MNVLDRLVLSGRSDRTVAALNLGGIANLTVVPSDAAPVAFDCGPANALLDLAVRKGTGKPFGLRLRTIGRLTWHGLPGSLPSCTGARGPRILGAIVPGARALPLPVPLPSLPSRAIVTAS